jgi:7,8-dihydroneopterin aldolase/epimerase/oxygenase
VLDQVLIEGLRVNAVIGVFDWERQIQQPLLLDVCLSVDTRRAGLTDHIDDAVNYKSVADRMEAEIHRLQAHLLEKLAADLVQMIFVEFSAVERIKLTIRKPMALPAAQAVGVCIERLRHDVCSVDRL